MKIRFYLIIIKIKWIKTTLLFKYMILALILQQRVFNYTLNYQFF
jgi:hypothetical protein